MKVNLYNCLFLSYYLLSCMVVPKRKLVNKIAPVHISTTINYIDFNTIFKSINMNAPRKRSTIPSSNSFRGFSTHSALSSVLYHTRIEQQSNGFF